MEEQKTKKIKFQYTATFEATIEMPVDATEDEIEEEKSFVCVPEDDVSVYVNETFRINTGYPV